MMSRVYLPKLELPPPTILDYLFARFPRIDPDVWRDRIRRGVVTLSDGTTLIEDSAYRHGIFVFYRREVPFEPAPAEEPIIVHRDENILVVDKPHGMPVTPVGQFVERSLLVFLQKTTGIDTLAPMHRLDSETAGILLLTIGPDVRGTYHGLFAKGLIEREYHALAYIKEPPMQTHWRIENRIERGEPWFCQKIVEGKTNAVTEIDLLQESDGVGLFRLMPKTGKKHQLRLHMASIGFPIQSDPFYPEMSERRAGDPHLRLLAVRAAFVDPVTGIQQSFSSSRRLD